MEPTTIKQTNVHMEQREFLSPGISKANGPSRSPSPQRKSGESSPDHSEYERSIDEQLSGNSQVVFDAFNTKSGWNVRLKNPQGVCVYYVDNSTFTPKKPDVTLHAGSEKTDPVIGACKWSSMYSMETLIGFGDYKTNESGVKWEDMKNQKRFHTMWRWQLDQPDAPSQSFIWQRAGKQDVEDANRLSSKNYKLIDETSGATVAVFGSNRYKSWKKLGKFTILADYGGKWELMVLLTGLALIEMSRRRSRARRSQGHGGP